MLVRELEVAVYRRVLSLVEQARGRSAKFFKIDLHVHSHESHDFPRLGDRPGCCPALSTDDRAPSIQHFVAAAKRADLNLMAITDHNRSRIAEQVAALSDDDLIVLPGMEVSLRTACFPGSEIHVLAVFPENYTHGDIERLFGSRNMPVYAERAPDSVLDLDVRDFKAAVHSLQGICIASHVNSDKGLRTLFRHTNADLVRLETWKCELRRRRSEGRITPREEVELQKLDADSQRLEDEIQNQYLQFLAEYSFDAIEVQRPSERRYYSGTHVDDLGIRPIPCVVGSDAHNLEDIGLRGYATFAKMTRPGFADLKRALQDPGTRLRFEDDVPRSPVARILGVQFDGGFFQDQALGFSDNLTCLIGGRGSGKSAAIEALRYVFGMPIEHLSKEKQTDIQTRREHTLQGAEIRVVFVDGGGDHYIIKRRYGELNASCYAVDGTPCPDISPAIASNLQVKIFGWGELEELARNKREQLALIDGFVPRVKEARGKVEDLMQSLRDNTSRVGTVCQNIDALLPRVSELPSKRSILAKLDSPELRELFRSHDRNQDAKAAKESIRSGVAECRGLLVQSDGAAHPIEARLLSLLETTADKLKDYEWYQEFLTEFQTLASTAQEQYEAVLASVELMAEIVASVGTRLSAEETQIATDLNRVAEELPDTDARLLLSRRKTLKEEVSELEAIQTQIDQKQRELQSLLDDRWTRIVPELERARQEVTRLRREKLLEINDELCRLTAAAKVHVTLEHQMERGEFILALGTGEKGDPEGILKKVNRHYIADKYARRYADLHSPHSFVQAVLDSADATAEKLRVHVTREDGTIDEVIPQDRALGVKKHLSPRSDAGDHFDPEKLIKLLQLEHCDTEDLIQINLDDQPIEGLSPGQRCSALIPIILLESGCPLIVDQPEDNLDNRLVFGLVVDILRGLKEKRQIIVATHNPNIPVSGDAEQIVVFDSPTRERCERVIQGSIDCDDIIDQVKAIMEGSEQAFRIRAEKYGYRIPQW